MDARKNEIIVDNELIARNQASKAYTLRTSAGEYIDLHVGSLSSAKQRAKELGYENCEINFGE